MASPQVSRLQPDHRECLLWNGDQIFWKLEPAMLPQNTPYIFFQVFLRSTCDTQLRLKMPCEMGQVEASGELWNTSLRFILLLMELKYHYGLGVNWFPMAAVTNCHKPSGFKQHKFIILQFWWSEVWNGSNWTETQASLQLQEVLGENSFPCFSSF